MQRVAEQGSEIAHADAIPAIHLDEMEGELERHRTALTGYCYRMLASPFEAEDAVQETMLRAWRGYQGFEGRAAFRSWLYRIATNVCLDMLRGHDRRATPMDLGPAQAPVESNLRVHPEVRWIQPIPTTTLAWEADPAELAVTHETIRLAFVAALQHLPPRQRAVLILCDVMRFKAAEVADLLGTTVAAVSSALRRARATMAAAELDTDHASMTSSVVQRELLSRYVRAFEAYDPAALKELIRQDARQSMPPFDLWLSGRDDVLAWWFGPGIVCKGSRLLPAAHANGRFAFGQYKPSAFGGGFEPWALQVLEWKDGRIAEFAFFLDTELFPVFGLPPHLDLHTRTVDQPCATSASAVRSSNLPSPADWSDEPAVQPWGLSR